AVSCLSVDFKFACDFLSQIRKKYNVPIIFGGIHTILLPEEVMDNEIIDYACVGEGEDSFVKLLAAMEEGKPVESVRGIWFRRGGKVIKNEPAALTDVTLLPSPDFDNFDPIHFYRAFDGKRYKMINYELSRGCPFNCSYCVNGILKEKYKGLGNYHRIKGARQSIDELTRLIKKYKFDFVRFWDEDFTSTPSSYMKEYSRLYKAEIGLPFLIYARVDTVTEDKVRILKDMGCWTFAMGIESGNESIRKRVMNRHMSNKTIVEKFDLVKSLGVRVSAYNMIGLPHETRKEIFDTIELNKKINPDSFSVTMLEPYKGTPIRKMCEDEGLDPDYETTVVDRPQFVPKGMTLDELKGLFRTFGLYVRFPVERYDEIKKSEKDDKIFEELKKDFMEMK
ncbi:MAG: radical SAM protein, partial [Parabacteroides sp.]|nr:radical SAM protein [Parabacteroides sp.]